MNWQNPSPMLSFAINFLLITSLGPWQTDVMAAPNFFTKTPKNIPPIGKREILRSMEVEEELRQIHAQHILQTLNEVLPHIDKDQDGSLSIVEFIRIPLVLKSLQTGWKEALIPKDEFRYEMANNTEGTLSASRALSVSDLKFKMDALVSDLSHALDESQLTQTHQKRRGFKRRSKITPSIGIPHYNCVASDDSSSSIGEVALSQDNKSSIPLSDSDDLSPPPDPRMRVPHLVHHNISPNLVESDSVNENFSPARPNNKRKQKCKRMALDPDVPSTSIDRYPFHNSFRKKKSVRPSPDSENKYVNRKWRFVEVSAGKRKRGRDRSMDWDVTRRCGSNRHRHSALHGLKLPVNQAHKFNPNEEYMDLEYPNDSNTSDSSTESETGIYTCDEGREADDEQSDWFAEPGGVYGVPGAESSARVYNPEKRLVWWNEDNIGLSPSAKALFKEKYEKMSQENQQACRLRFQKLRERLLRREIRAGRRRLQERRPGFSIVSSVNDKVSKFLQDPAQSELRLKPMTERDRDQLRHLAKLYSLNVRHNDDLTAPILTKTRNTITTRKMDACGLSEGNFPGGIVVPLSDLKRRRRTPPPSVNNLTEGSNDSIESVITNCNAGSLRPPVPTVAWGDDDVGDCCGVDSLSERLADSEPDPVPSPTSLELHDCTL